MNPTGDQSVRHYDQSYSGQYTSSWNNGLVQAGQTSGHGEHVPVGVSSGPVQPPYSDPGPVYSEYEASNNGFLGALHGEYPPPPPAYQQPQSYDHMPGDMFHSGHVQSEPQMTQHPNYQNCSFQNPVTDESLSSLLQTDPNAGGQASGPPAVHSGHPGHVPVPQIPQSSDVAPGVHSSGYQGDAYYDPYSQNPVHYPDNGHYQTSGIHTSWGENHNYYHNNYYYNDHNYHNQFYQGYQEYNQNPEVPNHEIPKRTFDCKMCDQKFSFKYELERHLKRKDHLNTKDFKCKICNQGFTMEYNLNRHYNMVHKRSIEENPVIPGLPQITTVMRENRNTRKISDLVTGLIETFECSNCHETFSKYDDYRSHMASQHTDSKKYICPHRNGSKIAIIDFSTW